MPNTHDNKNDPCLRAALYARVSSEQQAQAGTIESQVSAVVERALADGLTIEAESRFIDDGHSGATLVRPSLERLRDVVAAGGIDWLYVLCQGRVNVLGAAPFGYRYTPAVQGVGAAQYNPHLPEAAVVRQIFQWVGLERVSLRQVCRRLEKQEVLSPSGMSRWSPSSLHCILANPAYKGAAAYGKTCRGSLRPRPRPVRNSTGIPRGGQSIYQAPPEQWISIPVPAIVDEHLFDMAARQLQENRRRRRERPGGPRHLLQGLLVCKCCGYACCATYSGPARGKTYRYYRCSGADRHICRNASVRQDMLDRAVWNDVHALLADPARVERELRRRIEGDDADPQRQADQRLDAQIQKLRRGITRLIDAYEEGLVNKSEFEPRITSARRQLAGLQEQSRQRVDQQARAREMRLLIDNLQTFSREVMSGLDQADWQTRREIIQTLVRRVEIEAEQVNIVYRVDFRPFERRPERGGLQDCTRRLVAKRCICMEPNKRGPAETSTSPAALVVPIRAAAALSRRYWWKTESCPPSVRWQSSAHIR